jgi:hypothetical protein
MVKVTEFAQVRHSELINSQLPDELFPPIFTPALINGDCRHEFCIPFAILLLAVALAAQTPPEAPKPHPDRVLGAFGQCRSTGPRWLLNPQNAL